MFQLQTFSTDSWHIYFGPPTHHSPSAANLIKTFNIHSQSRINWYFQMFLPLSHSKNNLIKSFQSLFWKVELGKVSQSILISNQMERQKGLFPTFQLNIKQIRHHDSSLYWHRVQWLHSLYCISHERHFSLNGLIEDNLTSKTK